MFSIRLFCLFLFAALTLGCAAEKPKPTAPQVDNSKRPPLKIWLVDVPELEKELAIRWQAASDQPIQIETMTPKDAVAREPFDADVVMYPGNLIGDLVQRQSIGRLPAQVLNSRNADTERSKIDPEVATSGKGDLSDAWPLRWRNVSTFGGQRYAMPLGASTLGCIAKGIDIQPLGDLDNALSTSNELSTASSNQWKLLLGAAEEKTAQSLTERKSMMEKKLASLTASERDSLVDRFLWIASSTNARRNGLFELDKMSARIHHTDFVASAKTLAQLVLLSPSTMLSEHSAAWDGVVTTPDSGMGIAIGMPDAIGNDAMEASSKATVSPLAWSPTNGLVASVGRKTRQTAVASQFVSWLGEVEQRAAFRSLSGRIELMPEQTDRNSVREDYRDFQRVNNREMRAEGLELSLRIANADQYRAFLADSLIAAMGNPDQSAAILAKCSKDWNQLTVALGTEKQRISLEQSLGYRK